MRQFEKEYREAMPQTIGETDWQFDDHNYKEFLERWVVKLLATPAVVGRSESFVCGHPPNQTYLNEGTWHCEKCGGKWESIANK